MAVVHDSPLLTTGQVHKWEARKADLESQIKAAHEELAVLNRNLEAASIFIRLKNGHDEPAAAAETETEAEPNIGDAIVRAAALHPSGAMPSEIKGSLSVSGFDMSRFSANPGYFYTVLSRLVRRGRLERRRNGSYRVPASLGSPQGEPGAVAAPGSH